VNRLRVAHEDRHAHGRARDAQVREVEDLPGLGDDLPLFPGVPVVEEDVDLGQGVECDRVRVDARFLRRAGDVGAKEGEVGPVVTYFMNIKRRKKSYKIFLTNQKLTLFLRFSEFSLWPNLTGTNFMRQS
jgi:hypothetical protein